MTPSEAVGVARLRLKSISPGDWHLNRFEVRAGENMQVCRVLRIEDAQFIADAPVLVTFLLMRIEDLQREVKNVRHAASVEIGDAVTLKDQLKPSQMRLEEVTNRRDELLKELQDLRSRERR